MENDYYPKSRIGKRRKELLESKRICGYCGQLLATDQKTEDEGSLRFCNEYCLKNAKTAKIREKEEKERSSRYMSSKV